MASSSSTDSKLPIRRAPPVPKDRSSSAMQDLLTLTNDPFSMQSLRNELSDFNSRGRRAPPRPPPPKSKNSSNYKGLSLILGKDLSRRTKCAATAVVKPLPPAPVATGTLIDFDSPSSSPTFSKLSGDPSSIGSTDSAFSKRSSPSSGFDDDFDPLRSVSNRTTPLGGWDEWCDPFLPGPVPQVGAGLPTRTLQTGAGVPTQASPRPRQAFVMPTIIGPVKLSKPKRPPPPGGGDIARNNRINEFRRDSSPPMPSAPAPPPPPEAINILLNGPAVPPRPSHLSSTSERRMPYCIAEFDYQGSHPDDLTFKEGDVIELLEELNEDWVRGRLAGREGMFPVSYVRVVVPLGSAHSPPPGATPANMTVVALFPFVAQTWDDLDLNEGDEIKVSVRINEDWLYGECDGRTGQFPECFVQDVTPLLASSHPFP